MKSVGVKSIQFNPDSRVFFEALRDLPGAIFLDSGRPASTAGRYDILAAQPLSTIIYQNGISTHTTSSQTTTSDSDPYEIISEKLSEISVAGQEDIPFCGGAAGYFSYDSALSLQRVERSIKQDLDLPEIAIGIYDWAIIQDHLRRESWLFTLPCCHRTKRQNIFSRIKSATGKRSISRPPFRLNGPFKSNTDYDLYQCKFNQIMDYIHSGDCYQTNFSQRFSADYEGDPYEAYRLLRKTLPSPFSAYLDVGESAVLSLSPEMFLRVRAMHVTTKPIKGTIPRGVDPLSDQLNAQKLQTSSKDLAENLMIVDLMRNDLSKSCQLGSVRTPSLFALETYANVHHLVSTVEGRLEHNTSSLDLFRNSFPGGSITGAPKRRAMEIIEELENSRRSLYCGSIGYLSANGNMDSNIAIRSLVASRNEIHCWGGGGVVADSNCMAEYQESINKVQLIMNSLMAIGSYH